MVRYRPFVARIGLSLGLLASACDGALDGDSVGDDADESADGKGVRTDGAGVGEGKQAIVGGQLEPGRSAVVAIVYDDAYSDDPPLLVCSGVLITPTIVVTAAHCMHPHITGYDPEELHVVFGADIASGERAVVLSGAYSPDWRIDDPDGTSDIGALRLLDAAPVDPIAIGPSPQQGGRVVLVGYGGVSLDAEGNPVASGVKRSGDAIVGAVGATSFGVERAPSTTCAGDSGGATLADVDGAEVLLGIHSRGDCVTELWNERIDAHANGFLKGFMGQYGSCNADGACAMGCPEPDPDCPCGADGECDVACGANEDPDCRPKTCENLPPDGATVDCCDDGACDNGDASTSAGWGSAGCTVTRTATGTGAPPAGGALLVSALAILSFAFRRGVASRSRR